MKEMYRRIIAGLYHFLENIQILKIWIFEWLHIFSAENRKLIKSVTYTREQKSEIQAYWKKNYGKRIPLYWHRLYQAFSGIYCIEYFPEILFSTKLELKLVPYFSAKVLADKSLLDILFPDTLVKKPQTILIKSNGVFFDRNRNILSFQNAVELLQKESKIVYKPTCGSSSGKGVIISEIIDGVVKELNLNIEDFLKLGENYICQLPVEQCREFSALHEESLNTLRVITYTADGKIMTMKTCMRVGVGRNKVDNIHAGGLAVGVDEDGKLCKEAILQSGARFLEHPDSKIKFEGYFLPEFQNVINTAIILHGRISQCEMISWDFTIDKNNKPVLIEMNLGGQSVWFVQMCHGDGAFGRDTEYMICKMRGKGHHD